MKRTAGTIGIAALLLAAAFPNLALAKSQSNTTKDQSSQIVINGIDFGDNNSRWPNDGECDDPRFIGEGTAVELEDVDQGHDAADCVALFQEGAISLKPNPKEVVGNIDFGDDSSQWANNDLCDDPRFGGKGTDDLLLDEDMGHDATDCRALFLNGTIQYLDDDPNMTQVNFDGISFGDNTSSWHSDGECDDPRFRGTGMAQELVDADLQHDSEDCLALYQAGSITLASNTPSPAETSIDFGDDTSKWANDGECDDPRFAGQGMTSQLMTQDIGHDAADCKALSDAGSIVLITADTLDFGDNKSRWPNDGECDDPRFAGRGAAMKQDPRELGHDADDCRALLASGDLTFIGGFLTVLDENQAAILSGSSSTAPGTQTPRPVSPGDFGDDTSKWANDGECDDPRFAGPGASDVMLDEDLGHDATDCAALLQSGQVRFDGETSQPASPTPPSGTPAPATPEPATQSSINEFGDDDSRFSLNEICEDPRFSGPGASSTKREDVLDHDATDCAVLLDAGQVEFNDSKLKGFHNFGSSFGDDTSDWANNGLCDDPRFFGPGADQTLLPADERHDASDCRTLFQYGQVQPISDLLIDFGHDSYITDLTNNGTCDDPRFAGKGESANPLQENILRDATDCRNLFKGGHIYLVQSGPVNFGDDTSQWAKDHECDDPRFGGFGVAGDLSSNNKFHDATDCRTLYRYNRIFLIQTDHPGIDFGDNQGTWPSDGECDDPRFSGTGMAKDLSVENVGHDSVDCQILFHNAQIKFGATPLFKTGDNGPAIDLGSIDFGTDDSDYANNGTCDDPRFQGEGADSVLLAEDQGRDATDCSTLYAQGHIQLIPADRTDQSDAQQNDQAQNDPAAIITEHDIRFGDNLSPFARDGECDDPRFTGSGVFVEPSDQDTEHDADDCLAAYNSGTITLDPPPAGSNAGISIPEGFDFGDDISPFAKNGYCDDPRFQGEGTSLPLLTRDEKHDATDCRTLFGQGKVRLL